MNKLKKTTLGLALSLACTQAYSFGLSDVSSAVNDVVEAEGDDKQKRNIAIGVAAATVLAGIIYNYSTKQIESTDVVVKNYKKKHGDLPENTKVVSYTSQSLQGDVVKTETFMTVKSEVKIVEGKNTKAKKAEEFIEIMQSGKVLTKSPTKLLADLNHSGTYSSEFTFQVPKGVDQGNYTVRSTVVVDGKQADVAEKTVQFVMNEQTGRYEMVAAN